MKVVSSRSGKKYENIYVVYAWITAFMAHYKKMDTSTKMFVLINIKKKKLEYHATPKSHQLQQQTQQRPSLNGKVIAINLGFLEKKTYCPVYLRLPFMIFLPHWPFLSFPHSSDWNFLDFLWLFLLPHLFFYALTHAAIESYM